MSYGVRDFEISFYPEIDYFKCSLCLSCLDACTTGALKERDGRIEVHAGHCANCHKCLRACPRGAIRIATGTLAEAKGIDEEPA